MRVALKPGERCPIPAHKGSRTCCGRGDFKKIKTRHEVTRKVVGRGTYLLPDGRIERDKAALRRVKNDFLKAGKGCAACDLPFLEYGDVELAHIESCGMNGHKRNDAIGNLTLMHKDENREQGSRSLADYLADPNRIGLKGRA
jgi:hypothetical protein